MQPRKIIQCFSSHFISFHFIYWYLNVRMSSYCERCKCKPQSAPTHLCGVAVVHTPWCSLKMVCMLPMHINYPLFIVICSPINGPARINYYPDKEYYKYFDEQQTLLRKRYAHAAASSNSSSRKKKREATKTGFRNSKKYVRNNRCWSFFPFHSFCGMCMTRYTVIFIHSLVILFPFIVE